MGLVKLKADLEATGLPVAYRAWPVGEAPSLPFICYLCEDENPLFADGTVYFKSTNVRVELYASIKDPSVEESVETALQAYHWKKTEIYISTQRCYQILYEIEV